MKTITVLTDFSERAENAARYALYLAQQLHANIILYNSFLVPAAEPFGGQVYWSMEDFNVLQQDSEKQLVLLADRLEEDLSTSPVNAFRPAISCKSQEGPLYMLHRHKSFLEELLNLSNTQKIAANTNLPLLVYPSRESVSQKLNSAIELGYQENIIASAII